MIAWITLWCRSQMVELNTISHILRIIKLPIEDPSPSYPLQMATCFGSYAILDRSKVIFIVVSFLGLKSFVSFMLKIAHPPFCNKPAKNLMSIVWLSNFIWECPCVQYTSWSFIIVACTCNKWHILFETQYNPRVWWEDNSKMGQHCPNIPSATTKRKTNCVVSGWDWIQL